VENALNGSAPSEHLAFSYPLNALVHVLLREEGALTWMHYGLFERPGESITAAQERATALLLERLPPAPARILEVGIGVGTLLSRLTALGYDAEGLAPDPKQLAYARRRVGDGLRAYPVSLEGFEAAAPYDAIVFQESSQYVDTEALFAKAQRFVAPRGALIIADEFALREVDAPAPLHGLDHFLAVAKRDGFELVEELDVSEKARPTVDWFLERIARHRASLEQEVGLDGDAVDALIKSGETYRELYRTGGYGYRLLTFRS
jgi:SAM-dependent methyltransferase